MAAKILSIRDLCSCDVDLAFFRPERFVYKHAMETLAKYIPEDLYSMLVMGVVAIIVIWLAMFVVRKLIGVALVVGLTFAGFMAWHDPTLVRTARDTAAGYYDQWRYGAPNHESRSRW
jgi:hypothetical protein